MINFYEKQNQLDFINLLANGPVGWENSPNINKAVDLLNYDRMDRNYENGVYRDTGLMNYVSTPISTEQYIRENTTVPDITTYLN